MPFKQRKNPTCLNCNHPLQPEDNYCPNCGQENNDRRVSFRDLVLEVLGNLFSFDSQFARSVVPFLFRPGFLTQEFLAGRRKRYIHPLRLYFAVSFLFFLFAMPSFDKISSNSKSKSDEDTTSSNGVLKIKKTNPKGGIVQVEIGEEDTVSEKKTFRELAKKDSDNQFERWMNLVAGSRRKLIREYKLNPDQLLDSLEIQPNWFNTLLARQSIKLAEEEGGKALANYIFGKLPLMMFILMPMVALMLKLIYFGFLSRTFSLVKVGLSQGVYQTQKLLKFNVSQPNTKFYAPPRRYYIDHLIFTLHLHSFVFFIFVIGEILSRFSTPEVGIGLLSLAGVIYTWLSFKRVYQEGWVKTTLKIFLLLMGYTICLSICILVIMFIGVLLF